MNLSMGSADEELLDRIRDGLEESGARAIDLVLELSEKQLVREIEWGGEFVHAASDLGCRIALDGFVTGGKGSLLLKRFPIDFVKLGPPFVGDLSVGRAKRRKVNGAVLKAHRHGQRVIAQGVEDLATLQLMQELAIDEAPGVRARPAGVGRVAARRDGLSPTRFRETRPSAHKRRGRRKPFRRMRLEGLEPPRACAHGVLNAARRPIPPQPRT